MKKTIVFTLALSAFVLNSIAYGEDTQSSDYEVVNEEQLTVDNITKYLDPDKLIPIDEEKTEFIYKINNKTGYLDQKTNFGFITNYDTITSFENFLKVQEQGKFGVISKQGKVILEPVFQRINLSYSDGYEFLETKENGKYLMYYNTGKLVPFDELCALTQNKNILLVKDLKTEFTGYTISNELADAIVNPKQRTAKKTETVIDPNAPVDIGEISVSRQIKNPSSTQETSAAANAQNLEKDTIPVNVVDENLIVTPHAKFYQFTEAGKIGVMDTDNNIVIPAKYDSLKVVTPSAYYKDPVFVVSRNNTYSLFDLKGKILAEQVYDKINVYRNGVYTFYVKNNQGILSKAGKDIGTIKKEKGEYKYVHYNKFSLFKPNVVGSLIITIINVANL